MTTSATTRGCPAVKHGPLDVHEYVVANGDTEQQPQAHKNPEFSREQWERDVLLPLRLFGPRRDAHLAALAQQGCFRDEKLRAGRYDRALELTTLEHNTVNPARDIVPLGHYTVCEGNSAPDCAAVVQPDGQYLGSVRVSRLADLRTRFCRRSRLTPPLRHALQSPRLLLRHKATVGRRESDGSTSLASRHSLNCD